MSTTVRIPGPLRRYTDNADKVQVDAGNLVDVINQLNSLFPGIQDRLLDDAGEMRYFVNVYLNREDVRFLQGLETPINDGDEVSIVPEENEFSEVYDEDLDLEKPDFTSSKQWQLTKYAVSVLVLIALILPGILFLLDRNGTSSTAATSEEKNHNAVTVPDFTLPNSDGKEVRLSQISSNSELVILVFYRGYF